MILDTLGLVYRATEVLLTILLSDHNPLQPPPSHLLLIRLRIPKRKPTRPLIRPRPRTDPPRLAPKQHTPQPHRRQTTTPGQTQCEARLARLCVLHVRVEAGQGVEDGRDVERGDGIGGLRGGGAVCCGRTSNGWWLAWRVFSTSSCYGCKRRGKSEAGGKGV